MPFTKVFNMSLFINNMTTSAPIHIWYAQWSIYFSFGKKRRKVLPAVLLWNVSIPSSAIFHSNALKQIHFTCSLVFSTGNVVILFYSCVSLSAQISHSQRIWAPEVILWNQRGSSLQADLFSSDHWFYKLFLCFFFIFLQIQIVSISLKVWMVRQFH